MLTFEPEKPASGQPLRKTVTVDAEFMVEAIVRARWKIHQEGSGVKWTPIEAKCV